VKIGDGGVNQWYTKNSEKNLYSTSDFHAPEGWHEPC